MEMNDKTILRIKVPAHLYESVKAQLTLKEGKNDYGMPGAKTIKEKKTSDSKPKAASERPKKTSAPKKANAPQKATGAMFDKETEKMGAGVSEEKKAPKDGHKKIGLDELKALAEILNGHIAKMEGKKDDIEEYHEPENVYDDEIEDDSKKKKINKEGEEKIEESTEQLNEEEYDRLRDLRAAGVSTKEELLKYFFGDNASFETMTPEQERIVDYYYDKLGSYSSSRLGHRRGFRRY